MMYPDATIPVELAAQARELALVLDRLASTRADLLPAVATFWGGEARAMYDRAVADLDSTFAATVDLLQLAQRSTQLALAEVNGG